MRKSVSGERHDDFRRDRDAGRLNRHEEDDCGVSAAGDEADKDFDEFFGHAGAV